MNDENQQSQGSSFDGYLRGWKSEEALPIINVPREKNEFILYMACELYKNQNISNPKKQADNSINYAKCMYDALKRKGYLD